MAERTSAEERLAKLGLNLPELSEPAGNYVHAVRSGNLLFLAGKGPDVSVGKIGAEVSTQQGYEFAKHVALMLLAAAREDLGSLDYITRVVKVMGLINTTSDFQEHPKVIDGCSDLFVSIFGERGRHARTSVGVASLPNQIPLEIEAVFEFSK
jgi:enamine deaminase RidA (YjgF/YER057c/UK114 family)